MLATKLFDYELPEELIARYPAEKRDGSRMMVLDRVTGATEIHPFPDIVDFLQPGDAVIRNNTRVLAGRMFGCKINDGVPSGAKFELLLVAPAGDSAGSWHVLLKPGKRGRIGTRIALMNDAGEFPGESFEVTGKNEEDGCYTVRFSDPDIAALQRRFGHIPLPPYIRRPAENADSERYQTVYATTPGAVAAPTAGLHFTDEIFDRLRARGVRVAELTLHVGPGTFQPVTVEDVTQHRMHFEEFTLPEETARLINETRRAGHKVLAVGTTTVRVLESCAAADGTVTARSGRTDIFLYPPYKMRAVDMLLTNFHLPQSTLLMLVSCLCPRELVLAAYERAKCERMRFYSYGDCMLLK